MRQTAERTLISDVYFLILIILPPEGQVVPYILDPLGLGVKVSFTILESSDISKPSSSRSSLYGSGAETC